MGLFAGEIAAEIVKSGAFKSILDSLSDPNEDVKSACLAAITNFSANGKRCDQTQLGSDFYFYKQRSLLHVVVMPYQIHHFLSS